MRTGTPPREEPECGEGPHCWRPAATRSPPQKGGPAGARALGVCLLPTRSPKLVSEHPLLLTACHPPPRQNGDPNIKGKKPVLKCRRPPLSQVQDPPQRAEHSLTLIRIWHDWGPRQKPQASKWHSSQPREREASGNIPHPAVAWKHHSPDYSSALAPRLHQPRGLCGWRPPLRAQGPGLKRASQTSPADIPTSQMAAGSYKARI